MKHKLSKRHSYTEDDIVGKKKSVGMTRQLKLRLGLLRDCEENERQIITSFPAKYKEMHTNSHESMDFPIHSKVV